MWNRRSIAMASALNPSPFHRELADAIAASDPFLAVDAINRILDTVENEVRIIIADGRPA
jgi:GntR family transcriptional repressor for pyruvate dehydrogenase complex